jgi:hypothetical protein
MTLVELLQRMRDDSERRLRDLEAGKFSLHELRIGAPARDVTEAHRQLLRGQIKELELAIAQASRS